MSKRPWEISASAPRPWIKDQEGPGQGRKVVTKFYHTTAWRKLRAAFLAGVSTHLGTKEPHPNCLCIECARRGRSVPTHTVDHIKPINRVDPYDTMDGKWGDPLDWDNLQPLCARHNAQKTIKDKEYYEPERKD
ncbi:MAG: HNH endonuclease [Deltaproteobacteria bacterium]|nr:HNH endonuclease [Deltaproteobacteria bacterium]